MHRAEPLFEDYSHHHRTAGNKWCHRFGIPLIMLSLLGMLSVVRIPFGNATLNAAMILIFAGLFYYFLLGWRFGIAMVAASIILYLVGAALPFWLNVAIFVLGWILQFIGHGVYEKRSPAFTKNFVHLLVGPIWILNDIVPLVPGSKELETGGG